MDRRSRDLVSSVLGSVLDREDLERLEALPFRDEGFGYDVFGCEKESMAVAFALSSLLYTHYFRVESAGHEHVPDEGPCILAGNHSGVLPFDGMMIAVDLVKRKDPPRFYRAVVEKYASRLPFLGLVFSRVGQVTGTRRNFAELLESGELVGVFPEGAKGTGKPFARRYQLLRFNVGFVELALHHRVPIVPVAVVGAEEQAPMFADLRPLAKAFGAPYVPVTPTFPWLGPLGVFPYPAKYHIRYGEPMHLHEEHDHTALGDPHRMRSLANRVRKRVQGLIHQQLRERDGIYF